MKSLIYQKFLLSDNDESKVKLLFLLDDMFKKDNLPNIFPKFMSDRLEEIKIENLPSSYTEAIKKKIISEEEFVMGKIKYDDKVLHRSKIIKYFNNEIGQKKAQKDFNKIYPEIAKEFNLIFFPFFLEMVALNKSLNQNDLIHPNVKGVELIVKNIIPSISLAINEHIAKLNK